MQGHTQTACPQPIIWGDRGQGQGIGEARKGVGSPGSQGTRAGVLGQGSGKALERADGFGLGHPSDV